MRIVRKYIYEEVIGATLVLIILSYRSLWICATSLSLDILSYSCAREYNKVL